ncbi:MAG: hypothetical protein ACYC0Z_13240 [Acidobacteriaceae bacterium]
METIMAGCFGKSAEDRVEQGRLYRHLGELADTDRIHLLRLRHAEEVASNFRLIDMVDALQEHAGNAFYRAVKEKDAMEIGSAVLAAINDFALACSNLKMSDGELVAKAEEDQCEGEKE